MVKVSTLLYICDNLDFENEEIVDLETVIRNEKDDFKDVWQFLDQHLIEVEQPVVDRVFNQICQL